MNSSILDYSRIYAGILEQESLYSLLDLTADKLKQTLAKPEYAVQPYMKIEGKVNKRIEETVERVTGFGTKMGSAFEALCLTLARVPTQKEFNEYCLELAEEFWSKNPPDGIQWDSVVETAVANRNHRCYVSQIVELHCVLLLRELFPEWKIVGSDQLDTLMGVDIVVETETKRLYLHVMKNSKYSFLAFRKKQKRGGMRDYAGKFHRYYRDFTGDKTLMYEGRQDSCSETTEFVNGLPLFKKDWLEEQLLLYSSFDQFGEPLENSKKLEYMEGYLEKLVGTAEDVA